MVWAASQLDYRQNLAASNLRRPNGRSGLIGVLMQDVGNNYSATLVADPSLVVADLRSVEDAQRATTQLLDLPQPPTAVLALRNVLSVGALRALRSRRLQYEVALVGFDDFPLANLMDPPLTTVRQELPLIGEHVARLVFARLDGDTSPAQSIVVPHTLVPRGSGEISPRGSSGA